MYSGTGHVTGRLRLRSPRYRIDAAGCTDGRDATRQVQLGGTDGSGTRRIAEVV